MCVCVCVKWWKAARKFSCVEPMGLQAIWVGNLNENRQVQWFDGVVYFEIGKCQGNASIMCVVTFMFRLINNAWDIGKYGVLYGEKCEKCYKCIMCVCVCESDCVTLCVYIGRKLICRRLSYIRICQKQFIIMVESIDGNMLLATFLQLYATAPFAFHSLPRPSTGCPEFYGRRWWLLWSFRLLELVLIFDVTMWE